MKQFIYTCVLVLLATVGFAQTEKNVGTDLTATITANSLLLSWSGDAASKQGSWQVEASADGKTFKTIGLVWGADPTKNGTVYSFKQEHNKIQAGYKYFRVAFMDAQNEQRGSKVISYSK